MSLARLLLAILAPLALFCALPAPAQNRTEFPLTPAALSDTLGVNIHFTDPKPGEMEQIRAAGFHWIRLDLSWGGIEREPGKYDFSAFDRLMATLKANGGIRPLFILDYGNDLYGKGSPRTPEARAAFARFAAATVTHFKNQGVIWEMWNEPNISFWKPAPNVDEYIALALETGKAIRQAAPDEYYIGAGVSTMDFAFLERCFQAGLLQYWDAVSFHPYRNNAPETAAPDFERVRELIARYAPKSKSVPLISSEWGYSEQYPNLNLALQSRYIARELLSNAMNGLPVSIWYDWHDDGLDPKDAEHHFGTVYNDYKPKPTYLAVQTLTETLRGFHYNKRLALDSPDDYCLLFDNGKGEARFALWTTNPKPHEVLLPGSHGKFTVINFLGERSEAAPAADGMHLPLTDAPQYLVSQEKSGWAEDMISWNSLPPYLLIDDAADAAQQLAALKEGAWGNFDSPYAALLRFYFAAGDGQSAQNFAVWFSYGGKHTRGPRPLPLKFLLNAHAEKPLRLRATFTNSSRPETFSQETLLVARRPLRLTLRPIVRKTLTTGIENPSGEAFAGRVTLHYEDPATQRPGQVLTLDFRLTKGQKQAELLFPLASFPDGIYTAQAALSETSAAGKSAPVFATPTLRFTPYEPFAKDSAYTLETDGDPKVKSIQTLTFGNASKKLEGVTVSAAKISYDFDAGWKFLRLVPHDAKAAAWAGKPTTLGMWIDGDGSGAILRTRYVDATGQTFQVGAEPAERMDWRGWRYITFSLIGGAGGGHWGGANDGIVHYPIRPDTILLIDSPTQLKQAGELSVTGITIIQ